MYIFGKNNIKCDIDTKAGVKEVEDTINGLINNQKIGTLNSKDEEGLPVVLNYISYNTGCEFGKRLYDDLRKLVIETNKLDEKIFFDLFVEGFGKNIPKCQAVTAVHNDKTALEKLINLKDDIKDIVKTHIENQLQKIERQAISQQMLDKIKIAFKDHSKDPKEFFEKVLGATEYDTIKGNKADLKTLEKGFKALKANYPDGEITNNFAKVKDNEKFKDFLKICLIVVTLGVAALFDATTLQSTHKKNYESFTKLVEEKNKNPSQGNSIS